MKRITAIILSLLLMVSLYTAPVFAADEDVNSDLKFAEAFSIVEVDAVYPEQPLTRIELAEMFYRAIFGGLNNGTASVVTDFTDVPDDKKYIVGFMNDLGIMKGYSLDTFGPDDGVTYSQLMKTFVAFLGYDVVAQSKGGYPSGYLAQANALDLDLEAPENTNSQVTFAAALSLFKQALNVDIAIWQNDDLQILKNENYLKHYHDVEIKKGVITGNYLANFLGNDLLSYDRIYLDGNVMTVGGGAAGVQEELGSTVIVYYEEDRNLDVIQYYEVEEGESLEISSDNLISADNREVKYFEGTKTRKANLSSSVQIIYNGSHLTSYTSADLMPFTDKDGGLRLIDSDDDGTYDFVIVSAYNSYVVGGVSDNKIYAKYVGAKNAAGSPLAAVVIDMSEYEERNIDVRNVLGEPIKIEKIAENNVVNVFKDKSGNVKRVIATKDTMSGVIESMETSGAFPKAIKMNGATFEVTPNALVADTSGILGPGKNITVYFNHDGKITLIDAEGPYTNGLSVGLLLYAFEREGLSEDIDIKILTSENTFITPEVASKLSVNGTSQKSNKIIELADKRAADNKILVQPVLYTLGENGELNSIQFSDSTKLTLGTKPTNSFYEFDVSAYTAEVDGEYFKYRQEAGTFDGKLGLASNFCMFVSGSEVYDNDDKNYRIMSGPDGDTTLADLRFWGTNTSGMSANIVLRTVAGLTAELPTKSDQRCPIFVVENVYETIENEESMTKVEGVYVEGTTLTDGYFLMETDELRTQYETQLNVVGAFPKSGDILRTNSLKESKEVKSVQYLFSIEDKKYLADNNEEAINGGYNLSATYGVCRTREHIGAARHRYIYGKVTARDGDLIQVKPYDLDTTTYDAKSTLSGSPEIHDLSISSTRFIECTENVRNVGYDVTPCDKTAIRDVETYGDADASDVFIYTRGAAEIATIVFN